MELAQLEQLVTWLDEQRRQADQYIRQLEQRLLGQQNTIEEQAQRILQLESELAALRAQLAEYTAIRQAMENLRNEVRHMVERLEEERLSRERDQERIRAAEREKISREIAELRKALENLPQLEERLAARRTEEQRLNEQLLKLREQVTAVDRRVEETGRDVALLMEQRSQDHRRIGQVQGETVELFRRLEALTGKVALIEEKTQRQESALKHMQEATEALRQEEEAFLEEVRRAEADRTQKIKQWEREFQRMEELVQQFQEQIERFQVQYDKAVRAVADIERWQAELKRDVHEAREAQRLTADRMQKQLREFESEQEKRWQKQVLEWEYRWQEHQRQFEALKEQVLRAHRLLSVHAELMDVTWRLQEEWGSHQLGEAQRLLQLIEEMAEKREHFIKERDNLTSTLAEGR